MEAQELALVKCENDSTKISAEGSQADGHAIKQQISMLTSDIANIKLQAEKASEEYRQVMGQRQLFETDLNDGLGWLQDHQDTVRDLSTLPFDASAIDIGI